MRIALTLCLLPLLLVACKNSGQSSQSSTTPATPTSSTTTATTPPADSSSDLNATFLNLIQAQPELASRPVCIIIPGKASEKLLDKNTANPLAVKAGYYLASGSGYKFSPSYQALLEHSTNPQNPNTRACIGDQKVTSVSSRSLDPNKYIVLGKTTLSFKPWASQQVLDVFSPGKQGSMYQDIQFKCTRTDAWACEKY